jgi:hypothetical protein
MANTLAYFRTHKALREHTSWVRLTGSEIIEMAVGTEALRIHNVTEEKLVRKYKNISSG